MFGGISLFNDNDLRNNMVFICDCAGKNIAGKTAERRDRKNERGRRKSERQRVAEKGLGVGHKFDRWSNFSQLRNG